MHFKGDTVSMVPDLYACDPSMELGLGEDHLEDLLSLILEAQLETASYGLLFWKHQEVSRRENHSFITLCDRFKFDTTSIAQNRSKPSPIICPWRLLSK